MGSTRVLGCFYYCSALLCKWWPGWLQQVEGLFHMVRKVCPWMMMLFYIFSSPVFSPEHMYATHPTQPKIRIHRNVMGVSNGGWWWGSMVLTGWGQDHPAARVCKPCVAAQVLRAWGMEVQVWLCLLQPVNDQSSISEESIHRHQSTKNVEKTKISPFKVAVLYGDSWITWREFYHKGQPSPTYHQNTKPKLSPTRSRAIRPLIFCRSVIEDLFYFVRTS